MNLHGEGVFLFNMLADAVCILAVGRFLDIRMTWIRVLFAAWLGAVYAMIALYAALFAGLMGLLVSSAVMSAAAFSPKNVLRGAGGIWLVGLSGSGMLQLLHRAGANETLSVLLGLLFMLSFALMSRKGRRVRRGMLRITAGVCTCSIPAIVDTGNMLKTPDGKCWVIVLPEHVCREMGMAPEKMMHIAVRTASGEGTLPVFHPDECIWYSCPGKGIPLNIAAAFAKTPIPCALIPPEALQGAGREEEKCRITEWEGVSGPGCW